jgi:phosphoenolpyruvate carboxykinase (GTP)
MAGTTTNQKLLDWVEEWRAILQPDAVEWCDGSEEEYDRLAQLLVDEGIFTKLDEAKKPNSYWAHSDPDDVARVEDRTFICSVRRRSTPAPPTTGASPAEMKRRNDRRCTPAFDDGPHHVRGAVQRWARLDPPSPTSALQLTDSAYVATNMRIMTRMGQGASTCSATASGCRACTRWALPARRRRPGRQRMAVQPRQQVHRPLPRHSRDHVLRLRLRRQRPAGQEVLRAAHRFGDGRDDGWLAEHMLILKLTNPAGEKKYIAAAFPSACGKTNLAMLVPTMPGLEGRDHRRRHLLDEARTTTAACTRSTPRPASSAWLRAPAGTPTPTRCTASGQATASSPTPPSPTTATCGGRA